MIHKRAAFILLLVLLVLAVPSPAQFQGKVSGRVLDQSGNPVEKAEVTIVSQKSSKLRFELKTDNLGHFIQIGLIPGQFVISVKRAGYAPASKELHVGIAGEEKFEIRLRSIEGEMERAYSAADKAFLKGNKLYAEQSYAGAAEAYGEAVGLDQENWGYRLNLGLALKKSGRTEEALASFRKALELNPESYSASKELGEALAVAGQFAEARPYYESAAGLSPDNPDAQYNLGVCLVNLGESEAALPRFEKAVELKPDYADAFYQMGTILIGQNKVADAVAALEKFLALAPDHDKAGLAKQLLEYLKKSAPAI